MSDLEREAPGAGKRAGGAEDRDHHHLPDAPSIAPETGDGDGDPLRPDTDAALAFLDLWFGDEPRVLTAIPPDRGPTVTASFARTERERMAAWIDARQGKANLYFAVNRVFGLIASKAKKLDMASAVALHVDVDPRPGEPLEAERERAARVLREYDPPPSVILDSGGGYQGFWLLDAPYALEGERADDDRHLPVEDRNRAIEVALGGDNCHNIDRIMRLPGTVNVPGEKKRKKGRRPALARVVMEDWSRRYRLEDFPALPKVGVKETVYAAPEGTIVNGDCYWLTGDEELLWLALGVANSTFAERFYDRRWNNKLYAGRRRYITQYVEQFPLPDPDSRAAIEIASACRDLYARMDRGTDSAAERRIDEMVWAAFGLPVEEV
ncbi:MAG: hypothetical protein R3197_19090 [Paracoccaceae bacterium]|nr:hypothetical protein [Paracoccaceae bacterium]